MNKVNLIIKNIFAQLGGKLSELLLSALIISSLARYFSVEEMGVYFFSLSFVVMFVSFADMGMNPILTREILKDRAGAGELLGNALTARIFLLLGVYALIFFLSGFYPEKRKFILLMALYLAFYPLGVVNSVFYAELKLHYLAFLSNLSKLLIFLGLLAVVSFKLDLTAFFIVYVSAHAVTEITGYLLARRHVKIKFEAVPERIKYILRESYPIFIVGAISMAYTKIDTLMLMHFKGEKEVAIYNGALQFYNWFFSLLGLLTGVLYPLLSSKTGKMREFFFVSRGAVFIFSALALAISFFFAFFGEFTVLFFLSEKYKSSIAALNYLLPAVLFGFINSVYGLMLISLGRQKEMIKISAVVCCLSVLSNLYLIPRFSVAGACFSVTLSQLLYFAVANLVFLRNLKVNLFREFFLNRHFFRDWSEFKDGLSTGLPGEVERGI